MVKILRTTQRLKLAHGLANMRYMPTAKLEAGVHYACGSVGQCYSKLNLSGLHFFFSAVFKMSEEPLL